MNSETPAAVPASVPAPSPDQNTSTYKSNPFELIKPAYEAFKKCWLNILLGLISIIGSFIALVFLFAIAGMASIAALNVVLFLIALPAALYIVMYFSWSITKSVLAVARGEKLTFKASLPTDWKQPLKLFVTQLLAGLLIILGFLALIIPGIFAMAFWAFSPYVTVDTGEWGWAALKKSREITRGRAWDTLGSL